MSNSNISIRLAQVKPGSLHVGVDLALSENVAVVIDEQAHQWARFSFRQDADGYRTFVQRLESVRVQAGASEIVVAMEPTNFFWKLLAHHLEQEHKPYHLVNPYTVKKHREGDQLDRSKDDLRDAFTIADLDRTGKFTQTHLHHGVYAELRHYATLHTQLSKDLRRHKTILAGLAGQVFPELGQVFKHLDGKLSRAILRTCPAAATVRSLSEDQFCDQVRATYPGPRLNTRKLGQIYRLAGISIGLTDGLKANQLAIRVHLEQLEQVEAQIRSVTTAMQACLQEVSVAPYLLSIQGLSTLSVAQFLAEIGDPAAYQRSAQLVKLAGIQPTPQTSGRKQRSRTPMSHLGRAGLRTVLYFACLRLVRCDPQFKQLYHALQTREKNPLTKLQALGALMNKLLRVMWALMKQHTFYDPSRVMTA